MPLCRVLSGILFGVFQAIGKVYNAEIAHKDLRGSLGTVISNMSAVGMIYTYTTGYFIHRSVRSYVQESFLLHQLEDGRLAPARPLRPARCLRLLRAQLSLLVGVISEAGPHLALSRLVERGSEDEARDSLRILRGPHYDLEPELAEIVAKKRAKEAVGRSVAATLASRVFLLPFVRVGALMMIIQWAGINVISSYMITIFTDAGSR